MPPAKTTGRWPYRAAKPARSRRVVKATPGERSGLRALLEAQPFRLTPRQARAMVAAAALLMLGSASWWGYHSPWLTVSDVRVTGAQQVPANEIARAAGLEGDSIFGLDLHAAETRIEAIPEVRTATVKKHGMHGVAIDVQERTAWGSWQIGGVNVPIDQDGYVLPGPAPKDAPVIINAEPHDAVQPGDRMDPQAVELAARITHDAPTALGRHVVALAYQRASGLTAILSGQDVDSKAVWVTFGDARDYDYKIATLYALFERAKQDELALNVVDLRFGDRLSFR